MSDAIKRISDPDDRSYGQFWSPAQLIGHSHTTTGVERVSRWLKTNQLVADKDFLVSLTQNTIHLYINVSTAQILFNTRFNTYGNAYTAHRLIRARSFEIDTELRNVISFVHPIDHFPSLRALTSTSEPFVETERFVSRDKGIDSRCQQRITPDCLKDLYKVKYDPSAKDNSIGIIGFLEENANQADSHAFMSEYATSSNASLESQSSFKVTTINGGKDNQDSQSSTSEAALDVQYAQALTTTIPMTFYSIGGRGPIIQDTPMDNSNEPFLEMIEYFETLPDAELPKVISISYGDDEQSLPYEYANHVCNGFMRLGLRGISILVASGDNGVGDGGKCLPNSNPHNQGKQPRFQPEFPASCPWVTVVGGTTGIPETAASISGGGFSNYFERPEYQASHVTKYLQNQHEHEGMYNASSRAYPDISAQALNYVVRQKGSLHRISGTSASTPVVAGIIALLNDQRLAQGKPVMGFLNPWLYKHGYSALNDITSGSNPGCGTNGFTAQIGWDPITGLGTPDFERLRVLAST